MAGGCLCFCKKTTIGISPGVNGLHSTPRNGFAKYGEAFPESLNFESDQGLSIDLLLIFSYFVTVVVFVLD